jgi:hypothetical protein
MPILGLPDDLPDPARRYAEALPKGRYTAFPLTSLDQTDVAVWEVALFLANELCCEEGSQKDERN